MSFQMKWLQDNAQLSDQMTKQIIGFQSQIEDLEKIEDIRQ